MSTFTVIVLLGIAALLFIAVRSRWIDSETLQTLANIGSVVALLAAIAVFIVPVTSPTANMPTSQVLQTPSLQVSTQPIAVAPTTFAPTPKSPEAESSAIPTSTGIPEVTKSDLPLTPTLLPGLILFSASDNPQVLNPALGWQPGGSNASVYDLMLYPDALALIAGPGTEQWRGSNSAPLILYPFEGNFEAKIKVVFNPTQMHQVAGLGVRSAINNDTYLRISRVIGLAGQGILMQSNIQGGGFHGEFSQYADGTVYLKIERRGSLFNFFYSANGTNWVNLQKDYVFDMSNDAEIYLIAYSTNDNGIVAQFSDFQVFVK